MEKISSQKSVKGKKISITVIASILDLSWARGFWLFELKIELFICLPPKRAPYYPWSRMRVGNLGFGCPVFFMNLAQICEILKKSMKKDLHTRLEMDPKI